jgi:hypothetical protein
MNVNLRAHTLYYTLKASFHTRLVAFLKLHLGNTTALKTLLWSVNKLIEANNGQHECHYLWMRDHGYNDTQINFIWSNNGYLEKRRATQEAFKEWTKLRKMLPPGF